MSKLNTLIDYIQRGKHDELYTPIEAVEMILPYIPKDSIIWECTATKESNIVKVLCANNFEVIATHIFEGTSFFDYEPECYDIIITNPPYSLKTQFLARAFELHKPFMFLLPLTTLEGKQRNKLFQNKTLQLLIPDKRFNFISTKKAPWFQTSWFCVDMNLPKDLNFITSQ